MDLVVSSIGLIVLSPCLRRPRAAASARRPTGHLFRQTRVGLRGASSDAQVPLDGEDAEELLPKLELAAGCGNEVLFKMRTTRA